VAIAATFDFYEVSIHAPRCREAMQSGFTSRARVITVSIHAPRCREAMRWGRAVWTRLSSRFNPRPPLPGGDASA